MTTNTRSDQRITTMLTSKKGGSQSGAMPEEYVPTPMPASSQEKRDAAVVKPPRFNPFEDQSDTEVLDLSMPNGPAVNFRPTEIRFHSTKTVGTGSIRIDSKKNHSVSSFDGFYVRSYSEGEDPEYRTDAKTNKRVQRFAMTGKLSILPELHRAAAILILDSNIIPELSLKKILSMPLDQNGYLNICDPQSPRYSSRICRFGKSQFALHIKDSVYVAASGHKTTYKVCILEREKSEEAKKTSKSQDATFYVDFPARKLMDFYKSITRIMAECNLQPLDIDAATMEAIFERMKEAGHEPDLRALELVNLGNKLSCCEDEIIESATTRRKRKAEENSTADSTTDSTSDDSQVPFKKRVFKDIGSDTSSKVSLERPTTCRIEPDENSSSPLFTRTDSVTVDLSGLESGGTGDVEVSTQKLVDYDMLTDDDSGSSDKPGEKAIDEDCDALKTSFSTLRKLNEKKEALKKKREATRKKLMNEAAKK